MLSLIHKSSDIRSLKRDFEDYLAHSGAMCAEYTGIMIDLYHRSKNSQEIAISYYEEIILVKIQYLINKRLSK